MKKVIMTSISMLLVLGLVTGCGCNKKEEKKETNTNTSNGTQTVVDDQIYEGLEFVNVGATNGIVKTTVINNTGVVYEGSKFSMKIMDEKGNVLKEATDEVKGPMETGTTKTIETKVGIDLSKAASIEYSIVK
ncbi:MAG: hypothetical protein E7157_05345 [Lactobacillales bacterium]|nr:hypothetical protein [Lactobacillales bacterium]